MLVQPWLNGYLFELGPTNVVDDVMSTYSPWITVVGAELKVVSI